MPTYPALYTEIHDGDDGTANSVNSRLTEISDAVGERGDGTVPLASPDITSFVNSQHDHSDAANGGKIPFDNLDTSGATVGQKWVADGAGGGSWISGYPILSAMAVMARISDDGNRWLRCDGRTIGSATSGEASATVPSPRSPTASLISDSRLLTLFAVPSSPSCISVYNAG